jgi:hypothetical protein
MEMDDLEDVLWGYTNDVLTEILKEGEVDFRYLLLLFYSGVENYLLLKIRDPQGPPATKGYLEGPVIAGTLEITLAAAGLDYANLETPFIKRAAKLRKEA